MTFYGCLQLMGADPTKLVHMGLGSDIACSRCDLVAANLFHMLRNSPGLSSFWKDLFSFFEHKPNLPIPQTPEVGLLGVLNDFDARTHARTLLHILLFYARKTILLHWKEAGPLTAHAFFRNVHGDLPKFKQIYKSRTCSKKFTKIWQTWLDVSDAFWGDVLSSQLTYSGSLHCCKLVWHAQRAVG